MQPAPQQKPAKSPLREYVETLVGAAVLAVIGIDAIAPAAADLPRWVPLALIGLLLVWIGATAERRLAQARQLRDLIGEFG